MHRQTSLVVVLCWVVVDEYGCLGHAIRSNQQADEMTQTEVNRPKVGRVQTWESRKLVQLGWGKLVFQWMSGMVLGQLKVEDKIGVLTWDDTGRLSGDEVSGIQFSGYHVVWSAQLE